ncbi:histidinol-phosphatase HisJ [Clostridium sp. B9]|uniref:histidinol-phosphatase HisJ n=1 Tax=Clostridium sp. B9 TaxID=3423224 RepID=UPI003D2F1BF3
MKREYFKMNTYRLVQHQKVTKKNENRLDFKWQDNLNEISIRCIDCEENEKLKYSIASIRKLLNQYEIVFNGTQDALFLVQIFDDETFKYIKINDAYLDLFNLSREDIIDKSPKEIFGEEVGERFANYYKDCIESEKVCVFEDELKINDVNKFSLTKLTPVLEEEHGKFIVGSRIDITERKEMEKKLDRMANYDKLTNIPNRRLFFKSFKEILKKSKKENSNFAVLFLDLDFFKSINDKYGHEAGDVVLVCTAKRIGECLRKKDLFARLGGDEFAIILNDIHSKEEVIEIVEHIQKFIREDIILGEKNCNVDSSIGITIYPNDGEKIELLIRNADTAMYRVKNKHKSGYKFFSSIDLCDFKSKDGHVHTHYCPHGSDDNMEEYIKEGIKCGLSEISFTEHLPLPKNFKDPSPINDSAMKFEKLILYINEGKSLKLKYLDEIRVNVGVEVDYIEGYEEEIKSILNKYGALLDDSILSVHMIKGKKDKYYCIDFSIEEFQKIIDDLGSIEEVYNKYYDTLIMALNSDLGAYKPKRIGHFNLVRKFNKKFPYDYEKFIPKINEILDLIKEKGYELDFNVAGLRKDDCEELYIEGKVFELAIEKGIPMVLGSDSHSAKYIETLKEFL